MKKMKKIPLHIPELRITVYVSEDARINEVRERYLAPRNRERRKLVTRANQSYF